MSSTNCEHVHHHAIEGVLTYLNAFLILDFARNIIQDNKGYGVIAILIVTMIIFWYLRSSCRDCCDDGDEHCIATHIPHAPENHWQSK